MTWIVFVWYIANIGTLLGIRFYLVHRLELAIQDALKDTFFDEVDGMILRMFYLYQKSAKNARELNVNK